MSNEFLRRKRERDFQERVLAALERRQRSLFSAVLNSGFFLWLLSAALLSIGGGYITNHKQCVDSADHIIDKRYHIIRELAGRSDYYYRQIAEASTVKEANVDIDSIGSTYFDFKNLRYEEVADERRSLERRIKYGPVPDKDLEQYFHGDGLGYTEYAPYDYGCSPCTKQLPDAELIERRKAEARLDWTRKDLDFQLGWMYTFSPHCSFWNTLLVALGDKPKIVDASFHAYQWGMDSLKASLANMRKMEQAGAADSRSN